MGRLWVESGWPTKMDRPQVGLYLIHAKMGKFRSGQWILTHFVMSKFSSKKRNSLWKCQTAIQSIKISWFDFLSIAAWSIERCGSAHDESLRTSQIVESVRPKLVTDWLLGMIITDCVHLINSAKSRLGQIYILTNRANSKALENQTKSRLDSR